MNPAVHSTTLAEAIGFAIHSHLVIEIGTQGVGPVGVSKFLGSGH